MNTLLLLVLTILIASADAARQGFSVVDIESSAVTEAEPTIAPVSGRSGFATIGTAPTVDNTPTITFVAPAVTEEDPPILGATKKEDEVKMSDIGTVVDRTYADDNDAAAADDSTDKSGKDESTISASANNVESSTSMVTLSVWALVASSMSLMLQ